MSWDRDDIEAVVEGSGGFLDERGVMRALDLNPQYVREWAREEGVPRIGSSFIFGAGHLLSLAQSVEALDEASGDEAEGEDDAESDGESEDDSEDDSADDSDDD